MGDSRLKSRAYAAMTGDGARSFQRTVESRPGLELRRSARTRPSGYGRTSRNAFQGRTAALSRASGVKGCGTATNLETPPIATTHTIDPTDLNSSLFRYYNQVSRDWSTVDQKSQPSHALAALLAVAADNELHMRQISRGSVWN